MKYFFFLLLVFNFTSKAQVVIAIDYNVKTLIGDVDKKDTICFSEIEKAKNDFSKGLISYSFFYQVPSPDPKSYRFLKELDSLLKIDKIKFVKDFSNSDIDDYVICDNCYRKNEHCYAWYMNKLIDLNFGENYIFNQKEKADIIYISKHLNDTFKFSDCDTVVRYGNSKSYSQQFEDKNKDLDESIIYAKDFNYTNGGFFSYSTVYFIIGNDGKISDIEIETSFNNKENYKFKSFFEKQLIEFVKKTKWKPATARGFKVKSRMSLTYHYK